MEKKFAILRLTAEGEDRLIIVPTYFAPDNKMSISSARRKVMKQFENGTAAWVGWVDRYTIFDPVKCE